MDEDLSNDNISDNDDEDSRSPVHTRIRYFTNCYLAMVGRAAQKLLDWIGDDVDDDKFDQDGEEGRYDDDNNDDARDTNKELQTKKQD